MAFKVHGQLTNPYRAYNNKNSVTETVLSASERDDHLILFAIFDSFPNLISLPECSF